MAVAFGFSVGDFVAGIGVIRDIIEALAASSSSTARYQGLLSELCTLEQGLLQVKTLTIDDEEVPAARKLEVETLYGALRLAASQCQITIDKLLEKVKKFEGHLTPNGSGSKWKDALRKVQWALLTDKDLEEYRAEIRGHAISINTLLTITQMETMKLEFERSSNNQMRIVSWLQQGSNGTMLALTRAIAKIGRNSEQILGSVGGLVKLNYQIFQAVLQIHQLVSSAPQNPEQEEPIHFVDAFGKETHFYLEFVFSAGPSGLAQASIRSRRVSENLKGRICLEDIKTRRQIKFSREWQTQLYPGMHLGMDMIYERLPDEFSICPTCKHDCVGAHDETIICSNCGVQFQRIDELLGVESVVADEAEGASSSHQSKESQGTGTGTGKAVYEVDSSLPQLTAKSDSLIREQKRLQFWLERRQQEMAEMRNFRRFKFRPTRAESELSVRVTVFEYIRLESQDDMRRHAMTRHEIADAGEMDFQYHKMATYLRAAKCKCAQLNMLYGLNALGALMNQCGRYSEAEKIYLHLLEETGRDTTRGHKITPWAFNNLAIVKKGQGKMEEAEQILRKVLADLKNQHDPCFFKWICSSNLAVLLYAQGKIGQAPKYQRIFNTGMHSGVIA